MKVVHNTADQLILKRVPWLLAIGLGAALLVSVSLGANAYASGETKDAFWGLLLVPAFFGLFIMVFVRRDEVLFDRSLDLLELRHSTLRKRSKIQHRLQDLDHAKVETHTSINDKTTSRVALVLSGGMDAGTHPITPVLTSGDGAQRNADIINAWLAQDVDSTAPSA